MLKDAYCGSHTSGNETAVAAYQAAVLSVLRHTPAAPALDQALAHDGGLVAAHALYGFANAIAAREETFGAAKVWHERASLRLEARGPGTDSERALVKALGEAAAGRLSAAARILQAHVANSPHDLLALKLCQALHFMTGDARGMLAATSSAVPHWSPDHPGYGYLLGCHAFSLEEAGELDTAERFGRQAVEHEPLDVWGLHAVAHVLEMSNRVGEGIALIAASAAKWPRCATFGRHLAWHLALFHLDAGDHDKALALFDAHVVPGPQADFRDIANAASLLWRLEQHGVAAGYRWHAIADIAEERRRDASYVFASLHNLLALIGAGRVEAARDTAMALNIAASCGRGEQAQVAHLAGADLGRVLLGLGERRAVRANLARLGATLQAIGGSHAQRDVLLRTLILIAAEAGDENDLALLQAMRRRQRADDRFSALVAQDLHRSVFALTA